MLSERDLAQMRETEEAALPDVANIQRRTLTPDGYGNQTETWSTVQSPPCRIAPYKEKKIETEQAGVITAIAEFIVTLPYDVVINATDRLQINGTQYEIIEAVTDTSWRISRRLRVKVL